MTEDRSHHCEPQKRLGALSETQPVAPQEFMNAQSLVVQARLQKWWRQPIWPLSAVEGKARVATFHEPGRCPTS